MRSQHNLDPWNIQAGAEYYLPTINPELSYFHAVDIQSEQRVNWNVNQSYRAGLALGQRDRRAIRFAAEYADGYAQDGQFYLEGSRYLGLAVYFQL